jgi:UTP--glucose-1-phosphate uridylyltransferase
MHVLTPRVFDLLDEERAAHAANGELQLTPALDALARREKYLALELQGSRYDIGTRFGILQAQVALGLEGPYRTELLTDVVELLAEAQLRPQAAPGDAQ